MLTSQEAKKLNKQINNSVLFDKICSEIDLKLKTTCFVYENRMEIVISGEYSRELRDQVSQAYINNGWSKIEHQTSSENGERPGLTGMKFYF